MVQWVQERVLAETVHPLRMLKKRRIYVCNYIIIYIYIIISHYIYIIYILYIIYIYILYYIYYIYILYIYILYIYYIYSEILCTTKKMISIHLI